MNEYSVQNLNNLKKKLNYSKVFVHFIYVVTVLFNFYLSPHLDYVIYTLIFEAKI